MTLLALLEGAAPELPTQLGIGGILAVMVLKEVFTFLKPTKNGNGNGDYKQLVTALDANTRAMGEMQQAQKIANHNLTRLLTMYERDREYEMQHRRRPSSPS